MAECIRLLRARMGAEGATRAAHTDVDGGPAADRPPPLGQAGTAAKRVPRAAATAASVEAEEAGAVGEGGEAAAMVDVPLDGVELSPKQRERIAANTAKRRRLAGGGAVAASPAS